MNFPAFSQLDLTRFEAQLNQLLKANLERISHLIRQEKYDWDHLMNPLEEMEDELEKLWSPFQHLHSVVNSPELRACYKACLPKLSSYESAIGQNEKLYNAIRSIDQDTLNQTQKKIIHDALQGFELSGVALSSQKKMRFEAIQAELSELANQFENNVLDATQAFTLHVTNDEKLAGLPEHIRQSAQELAKEKGLTGWVLNLEFPTYFAILCYAEDRQLRETFYHAYSTRASDQGPHANVYDNTAIMDSILALRQEKANLLGFGNYAELSLATKMAQSTSEVIDFLLDLNTRSHQQAKNEFFQLHDFAHHQFSIEEVAPWDVTFLAEKMRKQFFDVSQEELRPYFSLETVMSGLLTIIHRLYGIKCEKVDGLDVWHPDVFCYRLSDEKGNERGYIYVDLFARQNKRGGAWMDSLQSRRKTSQGIQTPIAMLTCNFAKPMQGKPATLTHDELTTLFHELGHCLHHVLTLVDYHSAAGVNGVEWDAVELPSQFFENWCWEFEALKLLTHHIETGEPLPQTEYNKLWAAKNFQAAMGMVRQLEFSLFDFYIHLNYNPQNPNFVRETHAKVRELTAVTPTMSYNRFANTFAHIFSGGYAAGYYSYKWAELLSSDVFSRFEEEGIFNPDTGRSFLHAILEKGSSVSAAEAFENFRGRPAKVDALLRHNGIQAIASTNTAGGLT